MKKLTLLLFIFCSYLLIGCSTISSSIHYTRGTKYLHCGNYSEAIVELEQAVKLDSSRARYHTNLAGAYFGNNDIDKTWYHCRQAVRCPYDDGISKPQFLKFYEVLIVESGLNTLGTSSQTILESLGEPDEIWKNEKGEVLAYMYGICAMLFTDGRLTKCKIC